MSSRADRSRSVAAGQLELFESERPPARRARYRHVHSPAELAAFDRTLAVVLEIRPDFLGDNERLCPGGCGKVIRSRGYSCGRRHCDAVRPGWGRSFGDVVRAALDAYLALRSGEGKVLATVITCTHKPGWWNTERCGHPSDGSKCSGPAGCRVHEWVIDQELPAFPARVRAAKNAARTEALRKLRRIGYELTSEERRQLGELLSVREDQSRGLPHDHIVVGHTTAVEMAYAHAYFDSLRRHARRQGLGFTDGYRIAAFKQANHDAGRFHVYLSKLARYLSKQRDGRHFLERHQGERVFYVAPWLSKLSGVTMTVSRLARRVWSHKHFPDRCEMPKIPPELYGAVMALWVGNVSLHPPPERDTRRRAAGGRPCPARGCGGR